MLKSFLFSLLFILYCSCSNYKYKIIFSEQNPKINSFSYFYQGIFLEKSGKWNKAVESFQKAKNFDSKSARIYKHLAKCFANLNSKEIAVINLKKSEKYADKKDYLIYYDIGTIYHELGFIMEAKRCYKKSLNIFPNFKKCYVALASLNYNN